MIPSQLLLFRLYTGACPASLQKLISIRGYQFEAFRQSKMFNLDSLKDTKLKRLRSISFPDCTEITKKERRKHYRKKFHMVTRRCAKTMMFADGLSKQKIPRCFYNKNLREVHLNEMETFPTNRMLDTLHLHLSKRIEKIEESFEFIRQDRRNYLLITKDRLLLKILRWVKRSKNRFPTLYLGFHMNLKYCEHNNKTFINVVQYLCVWFESLKIWNCNFRPVLKIGFRIESGDCNQVFTTVISSEDFHRILQFTIDTRNDMRDNLWCFLAVILKEKIPPTILRELKSNRIKYSSWYDFAYNNLYALTIHQNSKRIRIVMFMRDGYQTFVRADTIPFQDFSLFACYISKCPNVKSIRIQIEDPQKVMIHSHLFTKWNHLQKFQLVYDSSLMPNNKMPLYEILENFQSQTLNSLDLEFKGISWDLILHKNVQRLLRTNPITDFRFYNPQPLPNLLSQTETFVFSDLNKCWIPNHIPFKEVNLLKTLLQKRKPFLDQVSISVNNSDYYQKLLSYGNHLLMYGKHNFLDLKINLTS